MTILKLWPVVVLGLAAGCVKPIWEYDYSPEGTITVDGETFQVFWRLARVKNGTDKNWEDDQVVIEIDGKYYDCGVTVESCTYWASFIREKRLRDKLLPDVVEDLSPGTPTSTTPSTPTVTAPDTTTTTPSTDTPTTTSTDGGSTDGGSTDGGTGGETDGPTF